MNTENRNDLLSYISDAHKDVYGFRPRCSFSNYSDEELEAYANQLSDAVVQSELEDRAYEKSMQSSFEASVAKTMAAGATDRETAVRWLLEANGVAEQGIEHLQYKMGVGFHYDFYTGKCS